MKKRNWLIGVLLVVALIFGSFSFASCDFGGTNVAQVNWDPTLYESEGVLYDLSADKTYAVVIGYTGTASRVRILESYNHVPVTTIWDDAFDDGGRIKSMIIPDSITTIKNTAFKGVTGLTSVKCPTVVLDYIFRKRLQQVVITSGSIIGDHAFSNCDDLDSIVIPNSITKIGDFAFSGCNDLTNITIPDNVTTIGCEAFKDCVKLQFNEYNNGKYLGNDGNPYYALIKISNQNFSSYNLHKDVRVMADKVFSNCTRLAHISIGESIKTIGFYGFSNCSNLMSIIIPNSVTSISSCAFEYCSNLVCVYYQGTASEWAEIKIGVANYCLTSAKRYYYSESAPTESGNYWHYDENGNPVAW